MISTDRESHISPALLPHQSALIEMVLNPAGKRITLLRADVGLGKSTAIVALSKRLLEERPAARILIFTPRAQQLQFAERLREHGIVALIVDRYRFRAMLDSSSGNDEVWPGGAVILLSMDFAKQADIRESLAKAHWEIIVADEVPMRGGVRSETLRSVGASAERVVITTGTIPDYVNADRSLSQQALFEARYGVERSLPFPAEHIAIVDWRRDRVVDHAGRLLDTAPRPNVVESSYQLTSEELRFWELVTDLGRALERSSLDESLVQKSLSRHLESSPPAIESLLRRLSERSLPEHHLDQLADPTDEEGAEEQAITETFSRNVPEVIENVLNCIDKVSVDSKLDASVNLLERLLSERETPPRICILTDYLATLFYLAAELELRDIQHVLIHGGMSIEDRAQSLSSFTKPGTVLLATRASLPDNANLSKSTDVLLYDIPKSDIGLERALRKIDRFGRTAQLTIHVLVPSNFADAILFEQLESLRKLPRADVRNLH